MPEVSVVLPCSASHATVLGDCLASLLAQQFEHPYEIVVVNSHGSSAVAKAAARCDARIVAAGDASTAGLARNLGVKSAQADILAFIDADCIAEPLWLDAVYAALSDGMIAVGGPVLNRKPFSPVAVIDNLMQFVDQASGRPADVAREFPGCNMAIHRHAFEMAGGFPADVFPGEDTVFSQRVAREWPDRMRFLPTMRVRHSGRSAIGEFMQHQRAFGFSRGRYALNISRRQQMLGRIAPVAAVAGLRRFGYFFYRTAQWNMASLPRLLIFSPLLLVGLFAWSQGFNRGCRLAGEEPGESGASS